MAFWPGYWGRLGTVPFALHAHGLTATAWLLLLTVQSWSIHARKPAWHRATGLATFVVLPMFAAAGPLHCRAWPTLSRTNADPFHAAYGARLVIADMIAGPSVVAMAAQMIGFATLWNTELWRHWTIVLTDIPSVPMTLAAAVASAALSWWAWRQAPRGATPAICDRIEQSPADTCNRVDETGVSAMRCRSMTLLTLFMTVPLIAAVPSSITAMKWDKRVLLVAAPDERDPALRDQRRIVAGWKAAADDRDLAIVEVVGDTVTGATDTAVQLRQRFRLPRNAFSVVLIGKDGGAKLRRTLPIPAAILEATIDAMPMRRGGER